MDDLELASAMCYSHADFKGSLGNSCSYYNKNGTTQGFLHSTEPGKCLLESQSSQAVAALRELQGLALALKGRTNTLKKESLLSL